LLALAPGWPPLGWLAGRAWGGKAYNLGRCLAGIPSTNTLARRIPHSLR